MTPAPLASRFLAALGITLRAKTTSGALGEVSTLARELSSKDPRSLTSVYRAVQVITTALMQLPLIVERAGDTIPTPALIEQPDVHMARAEWVTHMSASLALTGNAYALIERGLQGQVINLRPLNPRTVFVRVHPKTRARIYHVEGKTLTASDVLHAALQPEEIGAPFGLGPLQAAQTDIKSAMRTRDYSAQWFDGTGQPTGILSSPTATLEESLLVRNAWNGIDSDGKRVDDPRMNPSRVKVLPKAFTYSPLYISPRDAQWLEIQQFNALQIARLFGIPPTLALTSPEGGSMTYSNVEQDWIGFIRFTLMAYIRPIEDALSSVLPRGQTARFNIEGLLRTDTKTRYESHQIAITSGFLTINEARAIEGRPPLPTPPAPGDQ